MSERWVIWTPSCIQKMLVRDGRICAWEDGSPYHLRYEPKTYTTWAEAHAELVLRAQESVRVQQRLLDDVLAMKEGA